MGKSICADIIYFTHECSDVFPHAGKRAAIPSAAPFRCKPLSSRYNRVMDVINIESTAAFTTKDGSQIRELLAHRNSAIRQQSLAEARLPPGAATAPHYHPKTEEIYYILAGEGRMTIDDETRPVRVGDAIAIPPGRTHTIENNGAGELKFLCCCAPGYEHEDTVLVE